MNKKTFFAISAMALMLGTVSAQSKLSINSQLLLGKQGASHSSLLPKKAPQLDRRVLTTILLEQGANVTDEQLAELNIKVEKRLKNMLFAQVPLNQLRPLSEMEGIRMVDTGAKAKLHTNTQREASSVPMVHNMQVANSSSDMPEYYRGKDVLVAIIDGEFDLEHPAFRDAEGNYRIKRAAQFDVDTVAHELNVEIIEQDQLADFIAATRDREIYVGHGTHVAGIAAGSTDMLPEGNPLKAYYGMAPEADIMTYDYSGISTGAELMYMLTDALQQADVQQRPLAVNMSLGTNSALLDGSDPFNISLEALTQNFDMAGKIICISAGNEASYPMSFQMNCDKPIGNGGWTRQGTFAYYPNGEKIQAGGRTLYQYAFNTDFASADDREFAVKFELMDTQTGEIYLALPTISGFAEEENIGDEVFTDYNTYYCLDITYGAFITETNRYYHKAEVTVTSETPVYVMASIYTKDADMAVDGCVEGDFFVQVDNEPEVNTKGSINVWACNEHVISVGSYNSRVDYIDQNHCMNGDINPLGDISDFSSWGDSHYGTPKPLVAAPGSYIISAYHHNLDVLEEAPEGSIVIDGTEYYWGGMEGTSMSSPAATGIVALWLQANPNLTREQILDVLDNTCDYDEFCQASPERFGAGKINAKRGIDYILAGTVAINTVAGNVTDLQPAKFFDAEGRIMIRKGEHQYDVMGIER